MRLKNSIDSGFMDKFQVQRMSGDATMDAGEDAGAGEMQCRGCGCKLGSDILQSALALDTEIPPEDAAEIGGDDTARLVASTDFFSSPVDDPFLAGRITALHSASDIVASGAKVTEALANVVLPEGDPGAQRRTLSDFIAGARCEFDAMNASVVGGHTIVGPRMEVGFTVIGRPLGKSLIRKSNLRPGNQLYLTKPLGIGVLLAAQMRSMCPARDYETLISAMLERQHALAQVAVDVGIDAGTDVTGFGLAGHLIEMLSASDVAAVVELEDIPTLPGAIELIGQGVESSLAPDNLGSGSDVAVARSLTDAQHAKYRILFDPQTCGGLLLGAREDQQQRLVEQMCETGLPRPAHIGRVIDRDSGRKLLTIQ
jgi:selenide,water dikinase